MFDIANTPPKSNANAASINPFFIHSPQIYFVPLHVYNIYKGIPGSPNAHTRGLRGVLEILEKQVEEVRIIALGEVLNPGCKK
ncbi:MAG: hypothetical protein AB1657_00035 [Candidatus Micrarchaeota archaeon]